jgi:hypothetical protein
MTRSTRARAAFAAALLALSAFAPADAHPTLWRTNKCDDEAHPSTRQRAHAAPVADPSISFRMAWSAPDGGNDHQSDEDEPYRVIPEVRARARAPRRRSHRLAENSIRWRASASLAGARRS